MLQIFLLFLTFLSSFIAHGQLILPELESARSQVQELARTRQLDIRMLLYTYYNEKICQTCSAEEMNAKKNLFRTAMGDQFPILSAEKSYTAHQREVMAVFAASPSLVPDELATYRSVERIVKNRILLTCIDFAKAFLWFLKQSAIPAEDVRFVVLMEKKGFENMCPTDLSFPDWPRPFLHTSLAILKSGTWHLVNPESEHEEVIVLGAKLPQRLEGEFSFPSIPGKILVWAGDFPTMDYSGAFAWQSLLSTLVSGETQNNFCKI